MKSLSYQIKGGIIAILFVIASFLLMLLYSLIDSDGQGAMLFIPLLIPLFPAGVIFSSIDNLALSLVSVFLLYFITGYFFGFIYKKINKK